MIILLCLKKAQMNMKALISDVLNFLYGAVELPDTNQSTILVCSFFPAYSGFLPYVVLHLCCKYACNGGKWTILFIFFKLIYNIIHMNFAVIMIERFFESRLSSRASMKKIDKCTWRFGLNVVCQLLCDHFWPHLHN